VLIVRMHAAPAATADRGAFALYAALFLASLLLYPRIPMRVTDAGASRAPITPRTRRVLWQISSLFALDSLGGGFLTTALLGWFFFQRFHAGLGAVSMLFFGARVANALSHLGAAWLARRIGLVNTMVFTHLPSSLLLLTVGIAPSFGVAAALFLLRESLVEMDVPTRSSYVLAVVEPGERTFANGVTLLVRLAGWAVAPALAGLVMRGPALAVPLYLGAAMKIAYDALLYRAFRNLKPPEEQAA
jgi:hypothetical protein